MLWATKRQNPKSTQAQLSSSGWKRKTVSSTGTSSCAPNVCVLSRTVATKQTRHQIPQSSPHTKLSVIIT